jgi:hypothetical protein
VNEKIALNYLIATKADKGNSFVIIYEQEYNLKIEAFLSSNYIESSKPFQLHFSPGVNSASNRNEYQESFWGQRATAT